MQDFARFASRFHKLKRDIQGLEETEQARILGEQTNLQAQASKLDALARQARHDQSGVLDLAHWQDYAAFQEVTSVRQQLMNEKLQMVDEELKAQRERLRLSYIEQEKWSSIATAQRDAFVREEDRAAQIIADDDALKRYWKGED